MSEDTERTEGQPKSCRGEKQRLRQSPRITPQERSRRFINRRDAGEMTDKDERGPLNLGKKVATCSNEAPERFRFGDCQELELV